MDNLSNINNFLNEKRVIVKRRYTEKHPARNVSTAARVRNAVLDAISDGHITEEELTKILSEIEAHKRWLKRNSKLFNISEDETGVKSYSLSPYGHRVRKVTRAVEPFTQPLSEALKVPHKERGKKPVNIFVGRFQPFTLGHVKVFEKMYKENGLPVVVFLVRGGKPDPEKRPFDEGVQQAMFAKMAKQYPFLETAIVVPNGAIDTLFAAARPAYEPIMWGYGTDRKKAYDSMINKDRYRQELDVNPDFKGYEIFRTDDNISASKVRNALKIDDEKTFKKMTPKSIHKFYKSLQDILGPIKENQNMKNLKSLNDFNVNEAVNKIKVYDDSAGPDEEGFKLLNKLRPNDKIQFIAGDIDPDDLDIETGVMKAKDAKKLFNSPFNESKINEEYIELMPNIEAALEQIIEDWIQWQSGPATEPKDIKPARKELLNFCMAYLKKNIK